MIDAKADNKLIDGILRVKEQNSTSMQSRFRAMVRNHRLYTADPRINDPRDPIKEKGRSWITVPKAFMNTNSAAATVVDVMTSVDPMIRAMRVSDSKQDVANFGERVLHYAINGNKFKTRLLPSLARNIEIQGTQFVKVGWTDRSRRANISTTIEDYEAWWSAVLQVAAVTSMCPDPQADPAAFEVWCQQAATAGHPVPPRPQRSGPQLVRGYKGPWFTLPSIWNIWLDPFQEELQLQECIIERIVQPRSYLDARAMQPGSGLDPAAIAKGRAGKGKGGMDRFNSFQNDFYRYLDLDPSSFLAKTENDIMDVLYEVWMPNNPENKFLTILNESAIINEVRDVSPYPFGDAPYLAVHRIAIPGNAYGLTPYQPTERQMYELSATRSKRMDAVNFASTPAFTVLNAAYGSLPQSMRELKVGGMYPVPVHNALQAIDFKVPREVFMENSETSNDIDEAWGIGANIRGAQAQVGRVPATESSARQTQATLPLIQVARAIEAALEESIPWQFLMFREYYEPDEFIALGGSAGGDIVSIDKLKLGEAMEVQFLFQGATSTRNRETQVTLLENWVKNHGNDLRPWERRLAAVRALQLLSINMVDELVDPTVTDMMKQIDLAPPVPPTDPGAAPQMGPGAGPGAGPEAGGPGASGEGTPADIPPEAAPPVMQ